MALIPVATSSDTISAWRSVAYAAGNMGKACLWTSCESILLFYMVRLGTMPAWLAGALLAVALICEGLADFLLGYFGDRWPSRRDRRSVLWLGAPFCGLSFALLFILGWLTGGTSWTLLVLAFLCCRLGYSTCDIVHNTLLAAFSGSEARASFVSGFRFLFSSAGASSAAYAFSQAVSVESPDAQRGVFALFGLAAGSLYAVTLSLAGFAAPRQSLAPPAERIGHPIRALAELWRNRSYRQVTLIIIIQSMLLPMFIRGLPFFATLWRNGPIWAGQSLLWLTLSQAVAMPAWMALANAGVSSARCLRLGYVLFIAAMAMVLIGKMDGAALIMAGAGLSGTSMAIWAILGRSVRDATFIEGGMLLTPVGLFLAALKASAGLGNLLLGFSINGTAWVPAKITTLVAVVVLPAIGAGAACVVSKRISAS